MTHESRPPPPLLEPMLSAGAYHRARGELDSALDAYKKALMLAGDADAAVRASLYAHIGAIKKEEGKLREAELNYEKALSVVPTHRRSLEELIEIAMQDEDLPRALRHRKKLVVALSDPMEKADELMRIATLLADFLGDAEAATEALEEARALRPDDRPIFTRLVELYEKLGAWGKLVATLGAACLESDDARERAGYRMRQAEISEEKLRDEPQAMHFYEAALEEEPSFEAALARLVRLRTRRRELRQLERLYARLIDSSAESGRVERAFHFCRLLGELRRDKLGDLEGAIEAFSGALRCKPEDVEARAALASLFVAAGDVRAAIHELEVTASLAPQRRQTYRTLFELHTKGGRTDRAWLAAMALEELQAAELDHELIASQYRPEGVIRPTNALDDDAWDQFLRAPGYDGAVAEVLRAVGNAAVAARVADLAALGKLATLDPTRRQDPESTATTVRSFAWAGNVLGVAVPELYVLDDVPGGIAAVPVLPPATALGDEVTSGRSMQELAFLAGRHLTYYRPEHFALVYFPSLAELTTLFLASVTVVLEDLPIPDEAMAEAVSALRPEIASRLDEEAKTALEDAVHRFEREGGRTDLAAFIRSVELSACRAGLVLAGDLAVAASVLHREQREVAELDDDARVADLLVFCVEEKLPVLREWLGVSARASMAPPAILPTPSMAVPPMPPSSSGSSLEATLPPLPSWPPSKPSD